MLGIILAGGYSSRAKLNKMVLEFKGEPLICHTYKTMRPFVDRVVVVTGRYDAELREILHQYDVEFAYNKNYDLGMFSSVLTGVSKAHDEDILLIPGDIPNVSSKTYETILHSKGMIRVPTYQGKTGHPLFIENHLVSLIKKEPVESNLHAFLDQNKDKVVEVEVNDPFINFDVDTMEDYEKLLTLTERK